VIVLVFRVTSLLRLYPLSLHDALPIYMKAAGLDHVTTLPFPQPVYPTGWWSCTMAGKKKRVDLFREEDAAERPFVTQYYNEDVHRGALAQPEFLKRALSGE